MSRFSWLVLIVVLTCIVGIGAGCQPAQTQQAVSAQDDPFAILPASKRELVRAAFDAPVTVTTLDHDITIYRYWGGPIAQIGSNWFSPRVYSTRDEARRMLALPEANTAARISTFRVPAGTTVIQGKAASMAGLPGFDQNATGGGQQIYLPDPSTAQPLLLGKLTR